MSFPAFFSPEQGFLDLIGIRSCRDGLLRQSGGGTGKMLHPSPGIAVRIRLGGHDAFIMA
jgi:hypothetical protein